MTPHALDGCFQRVIRAKEHLADLRSRMVRLARVHRDEFIVEFDPVYPHRHNLIYKGPADRPISASIGVIIGEVCYNLRSALDYLVFELARLDSGQIQSGTQFPIEDLPDCFKARVKRGRLRGINPTHVAAIERLQPYNGCEWTRRLRDFSNRDKHCELTSLVGTYLAHASATLAPPVTFVARTPHPLGREVEMKVRVETEIRFAKGDVPVIKTLEEIQAGVAGALETFKPDF